MNPTDEALLNKNLVEVASAIHLGKLMPFLLKHEIFTEETLEKEIGLGSPSEQTKRILLDIRQRGQFMFDKFIDCLVDAEMFEAAHILRPEIPIPQPKPSREKAGEDLLVDRLRLLNVCVKQATERYPESRANTCYRMESKPRGIAAVFVNEVFEGKAELRRVGACKDKRLLAELFTQLNYKTLVFENTTKSEMINILRNFVQRDDHASMDSCVVVFSSHGKEDCLMCYDSELMPIDDIKKMFSNENCPLLSGKPKIILIQACAGGNLNMDTSTLGKYNRSSALAKDAVSDMIIAYSTMPGGLANRTETGSWYIHLITEIFMKYAWNTRLVDMLTEVNRRMNRLRADGGEKQTAETVLQNWQKKFYFNPGV